MKWAARRLENALYFGQLRGAVVRRLATSTPHRIVVPEHDEGRPAARLRLRNPGDLGDARGPVVAIASDGPTVEVNREQCQSHAARESRVSEQPWSKLVHTRSASRIERGDGARRVELNPILAIEKAHMLPAIIGTVIESCMPSCAGRSLEMLEELRSPSPAFRVLHELLHCNHVEVRKGDPAREPSQVGAASRASPAPPPRKPPDVPSGNPRTMRRVPGHPGRERSTARLGWRCLGFLLLRMRSRVMACAH